ncbi:MAG: neutral/alkaline non-lysosomal ceramidase N-terminal domain-containing protein, partial [Opitutaceae bacterium]
MGSDALGWQAGVARKAITPQIPLWMTGYAVRDRPAEGKAQELWVKALALEDETGNRAVLITADLCGVTRAMTDRVAGELVKRFASARAAVMINASHTHCGPALDGWAPGMRVATAEEERATADYTQRVTSKMIEAAAEAWGSMRPASLGASHGMATFGMNRRKNTEKDAPARIAAGTLQGPVDHDVPVLAVRDGEGKIVALLASYACHNTTLSSYQWHGDYAGCAMAELEKRHAGATALFVAGCGGNINPFPRGKLEQAELHGRELADAVDLALSGVQQAVRGELSVAMSDVTLSFEKAPTAEEIRAAAAADDPKKSAVVKQMDAAWAKAMNAEVARGGIRLEYSYPVQAWRLGEITWLALGGEAVVDYALRLKSEIGNNLWVFGYSNDVMCYIPSESVLAEGGYEGKTSMVPYGRPSA